MITYDEAVWRYIKSKKFSRLAYNSKRNYMDGINTLHKHLEGKDLDEITRPMVIAIRDEYYDMPSKCRMALSVLNNILKYAYDRGEVDRNVAAGVGDLPLNRPTSRWSMEEIEKFLSTAPLRLQDAMMLALYTGQRRSDLARMKWSDYDGDTIHVVQQKTGAELWIPVHPRLKHHLDCRKPTSARMPSAQDYILLNAFGEQWVPDSLYAAVRRHSDQIGLVDKVLHGVRKTTASILGEMGCTALQIMSITGHETLKEVTRYTKEAERKKMAQEAMDKWQ